MIWPLHFLFPDFVNKIVGGSATYVGYSATKLGVNPKLVAVVGDDFPVSYLDMLAECGIDISSVAVVSQRHQLLSRAFYLSDGSSTDVIDEEKEINIPSYKRNKVKKRNKTVETKTSIRNKLKNKKGLKEAIILKEILDRKY